LADSQTRNQPTQPRATNTGFREMPFDLMPAPLWAPDHNCIHLCDFSRHLHIQLGCLLAVSAHAAIAR